MLPPCIPWLKPWVSMRISNHIQPLHWLTARAIILLNLVVGSATSVEPDWFIRPLVKTGVFWFNITIISLGYLIA